MWLLEHRAAACGWSDRMETRPRVSIRPNFEAQKRCFHPATDSQPRFLCDSVAASCLYCHYVPHTTSVVRATTPRDGITNVSPPFYSHNIVYIIVNATHWPTAERNAASPSQASATSRQGSDMHSVPGSFSLCWRKKVPITSRIKLEAWAKVNVKLIAS